MTIGFLFGLTAYFTFRSRFTSVIFLNDNLVFFVLLPPMLFSAGFNLHKRRFFQNIFYINIYGILGTIFNFFTVVGLIFLASSYGFIRDLQNFDIVITLSMWEVMLFAATMCSIDNVAGLSCIKPESHPKLFSIMFGESMMKDCVAIVLFKSICNLILNNQNSYSL